MYHASHSCSVYCMLVVLMSVCAHVCLRFSVGLAFFCFKADSERHSFAFLPANSQPQQFRDAVHSTLREGGGQHEGVSRVLYVDVGQAAFGCPVSCRLENVLGVKPKSFKGTPLYTAWLASREAPMSDLERQLVSVAAKGEEFTCIKCDKTLCKYICDDAFQKVEAQRRQAALDEVDRGGGRLGTEARSHCRFALVECCRRGCGRHTW